MSEPEEPTRTPAGQPAEGSAEEPSVGELVIDVSERASILLREEIELAKTEVTEKVNRLLRGSVTAIAAGVFVLLALLMLMHAGAWLLNDLLFPNSPWAGFAVEAALFLLIAVGAGLYAFRSFRRGTPPVPEMAIEQAREIKASLDGEDPSEPPAAGAPASRETAGVTSGEGGR